MGALNESAKTILAIIENVDLNVAAATPLYYVPYNKKCIVTEIVLREVTVPLTTASFSIGFNDPGYDNVIADDTHTEITGDTVFTILPAKTAASKGVSNSILQLLVTIIEGSAATGTIDVIGYLYE